MVKTDKIQKAAKLFSYPEPSVRKYSSGQRIYSNTCTDLLRTKREYLYVQVRTRCHMQMFWQVRAHPAHACTCAKRYLHYTAPSLLVFHVGSIAIRRVSVSYWVPWLNVNFLRWRGGGSFRGWFFCHWLVIKQLYMFSCWLTINLSLGRYRRSTILSILSGRSHTRFQPVEVNN